MRRSTVLLGMFLFFSFAVVMPVAAESLSTVNVSGQQVTLSATAGVEQVRYFSLDSPKRLVVDFYGVLPGPHAAEIPLGAGFSTLRTGTLENRTRFVFDAAGNQFPTFNVTTGAASAVVTWQPAEAITFSALAEPAPQGSAKVDAIDFTSVDGRSRLLMTISGQTQASTPVRDGNRVQFSLPNTTLPRALRREFDTFAFPSAIHSATPYLVNVGGRQEVRMVVLLKGDVAYRLQKAAGGYEFIVDDGIFAQSSPAVSGKIAVPVSAEMPPAMAVSAPGVTTPSVPTSSLSDGRQTEKIYTGEKTSLVFDSADVRDILRLIAEISDLNIIASEEVRGNITLRLIDVPWDQALDVVLDVSGLGMIQQGNVVRVLPKNTIRVMREADLSTARTQEQLAPLETEVVTVSYADLASVSTSVREVLSERGRLTQDGRNKLIIISDTRVHIDRAKELITILDTPERQVMIEARIVQVSSEASRDLGVNWGYSHSDSSRLNVNQANIGGDFSVGSPLNPIANLAGSSGIGGAFTFGSKLIDVGTLDLQLAALETKGMAQIISTPRITTLNNEKATILQGLEIPYTVREDGETSIEFKEALLLLEVSPIINPDHSIIMDILVTNDTVDSFSFGEEPPINRREARTKALLRNGETTVIGGIFIETTVSATSGVPVLKNVPGLGYLFKSQSKSSEKQELLIFITPRIIQDN